MKKLFLFCATLFLLGFAFLLHNRVTDGFSIRQMSTTIPYSKGFSAGEDNVADLLGQPYHYIGKGCQFYAFESADGKYIIKFLKQKHVRSDFFWAYLPLSGQLRKIIDAKIEERHSRMQRLVSSCRIALDEMPDETGLVYVHFDRSIIPVSLVIIDKIGIKHHINPSNFEFILQKKALRVDESFSETQKEDAKIKIEQLVKLVKIRCLKGIRDRDRSFAQNVGFTVDGKRAIFIDVGQFFKDTSIKTETETEKDVLKRLGNLRFWFQENRPELVLYVDEILQRDA